MEIGPIFRALINHRTRFWLIVTEIALTLAVVANCVHMIVEQRAKISRPTGLDEEHILVARSEPFAPEFQDRDYRFASYEEDLRAIRALPGVLAATGIDSVPLSGGGSSTGRRPAGSDVETIGMPYFVVGTDALRALGVEMVAGRDFIESDFPSSEAQRSEEALEVPVERNNLIVTKVLADLHYPDGDAVGKVIESKDGTEVDTIVGVIERMHCSWPTSEVAERVALFPGRPSGSRRVRYLVRAEPGMVDALYTTLEKELLRLNDGRLVEVKTLREIKANTYHELTALNQILGGLSVLLVIVTSLGIIGVTAFSVAQRTREIGTRRALGATRMAILRYFLVENWVMTSVGLAAGVGLTYLLNFALAHWAEGTRIGLPTVGSGMLLLWGVGLIAALAPAVRGTAVPPVTATRTV
jgi:putative ABC transport system permease protein